MPFNFTPATGLKDTNVYVDNPLNPRGEIQGLLDQLKDYINEDIETKIASGTLADTGYVYIPVGNIKLILQWGTSLTGAATQYGSTSIYKANTPNINFPIEFPNKVIYVGPLNSVTSAAWPSAVTYTLKTCMIYLTSLVQDQPSNTAVRWFAVGY